MYKISFDFPNLPKDGEVDITGLYIQNKDGSQSNFLNGKSYTIDEEAAAAFQALSPVVSVDEEGRATFEPGPTLLEAFKDHEHVKVVAVKKEGGTP